MKKVLLASTALVMTAGMAAADVSLSGYAEMGIADDDTETQFHTDIDVTFTLSGETDGGLAFGASIDLDESDDGDAFAADTQGGETIFISGDFGTLTMGDTDGAFDWAMTEVWWGTSLADDHTVHAGANGNAGLDGEHDGQIARYDYSFGDFGVAVSGEIDDTGAGDPVLGIGFKYSGDFAGTGFAVGVGHQSGEGTDITGLSLGVDLAGGFSARANYSTGDTDANGTDEDHIGVGVAYRYDMLLVEANWGENDDDGTETDGFGVAVNYDLGGGAVVMVGYGSDDASDTWSAGLGLSF